MEGRGEGGGGGRGGGGGGRGGRGGGGMTETFVRRDVFYARCCHRGGWYSDGRLT